MTEMRSLIKMKNIASRNTSTVALIILFIIGATLVPNFLSEVNLTGILFQYSVIGFLALGQMLVILTGGFDLAQGAMLAFTSVVISVVMNTYGLVPAIIAGVLSTSTLGFVSGLLVSRTKMPPFIVTLGMTGIARALAMVAANAKPVPINNEIFGILGSGSINRIPIPAILFVSTCIIVYFFLTQRKLGRYIYSVGSNEESSIVSGINVKNVKLFVYTISGFLTAIGALIWSARLTSGSPTGGDGYEMESIAAVVVGGGSLLGGEGKVLGTFSGVMIFGIINSILNLVHVSSLWQGTFKGVLILIAVSLSTLRRSNKVKEKR